MNVLRQWFSNFSIHQNPLEFLLKHRLLSTLQFDSVVLVGKKVPRVCISNKFPVILMLPVLGPHFEKYCFGSCGEEAWKFADANLPDSDSDLIDPKWILGHKTREKNQTSVCMCHSKEKYDSFIPPLSYTYASLHKMG